jgi:hypothetical protein
MVPLLPRQDRLVLLTSDGVTDVLTDQVMMEVALGAAEEVGGAGCVAREGGEGGAGGVRGTLVAGEQWGGGGGGSCQDRQAGMWETSPPPCAPLDSQPPAWVWLGR